MFQLAPFPRGQDAVAVGPGAVVCGDADQDDLTAVGLRVGDDEAAMMGRFLALQRRAKLNWIIGGWSFSPPSGNKTSPIYGEVDYRIVCVDDDGDQLWERSFGGSGRDELVTIELASDGGVVLAGTSNSGASGIFWWQRFGSDGNSAAGTWGRVHRRR